MRLRFILSLRGRPLDALVRGPRLSDHCCCDGEVDEDGQQILDDRCEGSATEGRVVPRGTEQPREQHCCEGGRGACREQSKSYRQCHGGISPPPPDERTGDRSQGEADHEACKQLATGHPTHCDTDG